MRSRSRVFRRARGEPARSRFLPWLLVAGGFLCGALSARAGESAGESWRVQLLATRDAAKARRLAESIAGTIDAPVHVVFTGSLYKVQVGDAPTREEAEALPDRLPPDRSGEAWIVRVALPAPAEPAPVSPERTAPVPGFRVQFFASRDEGRARREAARAGRALGCPVRVEREGKLFKARAAGFDRKEAALRFLRRARSRGFAEAWLVPAGPGRDPDGEGAPPAVPR